MSKTRKSKPAAAPPQEPPPAPPEAPALGIECPACGCHDFSVVYTRRHSFGMIQRRRQCRYCGRRITTSERRIGPG